MTRFCGLAKRVQDLEAREHYVTLSDGTKFKVENSGICLYFRYVKLYRDLEREPELEDMSPEDRETWRCYSLWHPDPLQHGAISVLLSDMGRKLIDRS